MTAPLNIRSALIAGMFGALALALSTGSVTAQIKVAGFKEYSAAVVAIDPPRLQLSNKEEMRRPGKVVQVSIIEAVVGECDRSSIVAALETATKTFSGEYKDMPLADGGPREALDALNRLYQDRMVVDVSTSGHPCAGEKLRIDGYRALTKTRTVTSGNDTVKIVTWVKKISEADRSYGTALASFTVVGVPSATVFNTREHTQKFRFNVEDVSLNVQNEPSGGAAKKQSLELQGVFKQKVRKNAVKLGNWLNKTRHLLSKEDRDKILVTPAGQTLDFTKHLNISWAGEPKKISVMIRVVAGQFKPDFGPLGRE